MSVRCFWLKETNRAALGLRRYRSGQTQPCPRPHGYHDALVYIDEIRATKSEPDEYGHRHWVYPDKPEIPHDYPRWPTACACGYVFAPDDEWQVWTEAIYRRTETGEDTSIRDAGPGAMWDAWWMGDLWRGPDGRCLVVKLPNGHDWTIDGIASNCDAPCLDCGAPMSAHLAQSPTIPCRRLNPTPHKCWVRHGEPPRITVDKNGVTCHAGAGSILSGDYHGFLRDGVFT